MTIVRTIVTAFAFLTRIPMPDVGADEARVRSATLWFPLVGLAVGAVVGAVYVGLSAITDPLVAAAVALTVGIAITGGFHEDGLGDTADGFGGGWTVERRLEIMRDSRLGTYGVLAIGCSLIVRLAALSTLDGLTAIATVAAAHLLARNVALVVMGLGHPARVDGLAASAADTNRGKLAIAVTCWFAVALIVVGPRQVVLLALGATLAAGITTWLAYRKIGGISGDVLGAVEQVAESTALVVASTSTYGN